MNGKWGNGSSRKKNLENAGYNYSEIQEEVSKLSKVSSSKPQASQNNQSSSSGTSKPNNSSGFNFKGHHFNLKGFSGSGAVPQETNNVYRWNNKPTHYLVERISPAGRVIRQVNVGDEVVIDGTAYRITNRRSGVPNDYNAIGVIDSVSHSISFQTCDTTKGPNGLSDVTIWWGVKK